MIYRDFQDMKLSALGFGSMRLPVVGGNDAQIDEAAALAMVDYALAHGVNYFDTAWGYHSGNSELVMGKALARHPREKFFLATKFPGYDLANMDKVEAIFEKQLEKCRVEYFDFYLFHNVCEMNIDAYLDPKYGIHDYLMKQKASGRIRHLGFSAHGAYPVLKRFLDAYGKDMEFCQLQINYLDWDFQDAKAKVELLKEHSIPVWVMEPLRGGKLAHLAPEYEARLKALRPQESIPAWAFRFLQSLPTVAVTLSGIALHGLPLLRQPLSAGSGHPAPVGTLQRTLLHRRRLHRPHGPRRRARGQAARRLPRLPQLRGRLPAADQNIRSNGRLCPEVAGLRNAHRASPNAGTLCPVQGGGQSDESPLCGQELRRRQHDRREGLRSAGSRYDGWRPPHCR